MLLDALGGPILCTQPRRLAVVAVAKRVAEVRCALPSVKVSNGWQERGATLGNEVGYHIGQKNLSKLSTQILFMTCGVLLEQLRTNGLDATLSRSVGTD